MATNPHMAIFGIKEDEKNKFLPHYYVLHRLYKHSHIVHLNTRSVHQTAPAFDQIDFWSLDSDFIFAEDMLSIHQMMTRSDSHMQYFKEFLKVFRIAHGYLTEDFSISEWTKNKDHVLDIYSSMLASDVVLVSPVVEELYKTELYKVFSKKVADSLRNKFVVLPPPDYYKFEQQSGTKSFKKLSFLWHHRMVASKQFDVFLDVISKFHTRYPEVPIELRLISHDPAERVLAKVPDNVKKYTIVDPFQYVDAEYEKLLKATNITLATSKIESFGIGVLDSIKYKQAVIPLKCNSAYLQIVGDQYAVNEKDMVDAIHKVWASEKYRKTMLAYNEEGIAQLPSRAEYSDTLKAKLSQVFEDRLAVASTKSPKLTAVMKAIEKYGAINKHQAYEAMGWKSTGAISNQFWGEYYYALRKLGVKIRHEPGQVFYYLNSSDAKKAIANADKPAAIVVPNSKGLFHD